MTHISCKPCSLSFVVKAPYVQLHSIKLLHCTTVYVTPPRRIQTQYLRACCHGKYNESMTSTSKLRTKLCTKLCKLLNIYFIHFFASYASIPTRELGSSGPPSPPASSLLQHLTSPHKFIEFWSPSLTKSTPPNSHPTMQRGATASQPLHCFPGHPLLSGLSRRPSTVSDAAWRGLWDNPRQGAPSPRRHCTRLADCSPWRCAQTAYSCDTACWCCRSPEPEPETSHQYKIQHSKPRHHG